MKQRFVWKVCAALVLVFIIAFVSLAAPASAQGENPPVPGPTAKNCFSTQYHAASDCDRVASTSVNIPATGAELYAPTLQECYSSRFHAASDCDRLASQAAIGLSSQ